MLEPASYFSAEWPEYLRIAANRRGGQSKQMVVEAVQPRAMMPIHMWCPRTPSGNCGRAGAATCRTRMRPDDSAPGGTRTRAARLKRPPL